MSAKVRFSGLSFSYNQFMVFDHDVRLPGCDWTERHIAQGFARRASTVNVGTLLEFGRADVAVSLDAYEARQEYQRVIAVPFLVTSGEVLIEGPEETAAQRSLKMPAGEYRLVAAQYVVSPDAEVIDLYFEVLANRSTHSVIVIADERLAHAPVPLLETAGIAGCHRRP